jgi:2-polyprenyl-6-methoxyphenol hydroxylase-like FAD-dependent oxidoreductase
LLALAPHSVTAALAAQHGGAARPLADGNLRMFETLRQSLEAAMVHGSKVIERTLYARRPVLTRLTDGLAYLLLRVGVALTGKGGDY